MKQTLTKLGGALFFLLFLVTSSAKATITATWDFTGDVPTGIRTATNYGSGVEKYIDSTVDGVQLYVNTGADGKFSMNGGTSYIQMNPGTTVRIPVVSTNDVVTISFAGNSGYCTLSSPHTATPEEVAQGYVQFGAVTSSTYINSISVELAYKPMEVAAKWTFDTGYSIDGRICTPNSSVWEAIPASATQAKNNNAYQFNANIRYQSNRNYLAYIGNDDTGKTYYQVKDNNGDKVLNLYPNGTVNAIDGDYTNEAKHLLYYEFTFPTIGLKDIKMSVEFAYHNADGKTMEMVYSTDEGSTWSDAGSIAGGANWYTYNTTTTALSADNKANVIVHLLPEDGSSLQVYINSVTITGKRATTDATISDAKYATYYNSIPVELPANLQAATIDDETEKSLTLNYRYAEGDIIPGGTPVVLKATAAGDYTLTYAANNTDAAPAGNLLYGSDVATTTTGGGDGAKYYALQYGAGANASKLGFYWVNTGGAAFESSAHKAWLALPAATSAHFFSLDDDVTAIESLTSARPQIEGAYFDLMGRKVAQPTKGLYIVNGKKIVVK